MQEEMLGFQVVGGTRRILSDP